MAIIRVTLYLTLKTVQLALRNQNLDYNFFHNTDRQLYPFSILLKWFDCIEGTTEHTNEQVNN